MKTIRIVYLLFVILLTCSCSREESTLSDYRTFAKELRVNSSNYTAEEWDEAVRKYEKLEETVAQCNFSKKEKKELNRLRGQCAAYMLKTITKQTKLHMEDVMEQFSDMAEGFNEAIGEEGIDGLFDDEE